MTRHFLPPSHDAGIVPAMLIAAARCWREARDNRQSVQPGLFSLLSRDGHDMLAPVFDSFLTLAEAVSGRRIAIGKGAHLSEDEHRLIGLFEGTGFSSGKSGLASSLDCAVKSLRILSARTISTPVARLAA
ncbi:MULTISPECIES: hypothetical protein [Sphingomonadaceae]|jgi:hypothetical protein|uniref:Uncharacterized protein n=1 Tax=Sphingomonas sanguinis TaxID=33051 RepID=A0A7Y7USG2_9SPHN|nr:MULTISPECIES: hypothetical protein [Sphingomonadaceae]MBX9665174.1 hypothetical protein [Novosphingobium sp.]MBZ6382634.1 hypothetical protein [Sphingomonas sanguinis]NNG50143.1 hypothetical protein [Sphingomonas sanguinis]NNG54519.1 hypothetical protein [Sphingomonas sanguinis]NVP31933.1 hypothetical protein [Sphingomonas sanguinis]